MEYRKVHMGAAKCGLDLGDGSERAEYVCQDYILEVLKRPHRMVNIMYTYYPKDKQWPQRISEACKDMEVSFQWDYPYDDYAPFADNGKQFEEMRDIRMHGQDVLLTLTIDCSLEDEYLRDIARKLRPFGRMFLRINHECYGTWFTHNTRYSYKEVADFFVRFVKIIKAEAPNVRCVFCAGTYEEGDAEGTGKVQQEDDFLKCYEIADVWSADKYLALHYGWPYDYAEAGGGRYYADSVDRIFNKYKDTYEHLCKMFGQKPLIQAEFNVDGDVTGPFLQGEPVTRYYNRIKAEKADFISGISMYQFRDRGRLGLEIESPNNKSIGIRQPIMDDYIKIMFDEYFYPRMSDGETAAFPAVLRWGSSEDADGIGCDIHFEKTPVFCEVTLPKEGAYMMEFHGRWFYKAPGAEVIDLMPAFFDKPLDKEETIRFNIFATPADGENHDDGRSDWAENCLQTLDKEPEFRIRYEIPGLVG